MLSLSTVIGLSTAGLAFFVGATYALMKLCGFPFPLGNPTIVILVLFMGGVQLISVGILGEYIGRIYDEVKARPKFIVDSMIGNLSAQPPINASFFSTETQRPNSTL